MSLVVGVIGAGVRGRHSWERVMKACRRDVEIAALALDPGTCPAMLEGYSEDDAREYARHLGAEYVSDYRAMLERDEIDVISLMVEPRRVPVVGREVAVLGKPFVTDKPIATRADDARGLVEVCREQGVEALVTYFFRYSPSVLYAKTAIDADRLGSLLIANVELLFHNGPLQGFTASAEYAGAVGGGELVNFGSYALDVLTWLVGRRVARVYAQKGNLFYPDYAAAGIEDFAVLMVEFEGGCKGHLVTGRTPARVSGGPTLRIDLTGTRGSLTVSGTSDAIAIEAGACPEDVRVGTSAQEQMMRSFLDAVERGAPSPIPLAHGLVVQEVLDAAHASASRNAWVDVATKSSR